MEKSNGAHCVFVLVGGCGLGLHRYFLRLGCRQDIGKLWPYSTNSRVGSTQKSSAEWKWHPWLDMG